MNYSDADDDSPPLELSPRALRLFGYVLTLIASAMVLGLLLALAQGAGLI